MARGRLAGKLAEEREGWDALLAIEKIGSPAGATWICAALPQLDWSRRRMSLTVLADVESPENIGRLATLLAPDFGKPDGAAGQAFLRLLGRCN